MLTWFRDMIVEKSGHFWTTYLPRLVNVVCECPFRKVLVKFRRKTMRFCTWGSNEVPSERGRICQNCRDWFAISRKLVQTFFVEFHFLWKPCYFPISFLAVDQSLFPFFLQMFCDVLFWRIMMMMGLPFCHIIHGFFASMRIGKRKNIWTSGITLLNQL